jgi:Domain of unknown function (DUF4105)
LAVAFGFLLWSCAAIWFDAPVPTGIKVALGILLVSSSLVSLDRVRPLTRAALVPLALAGLVLVWWLQIEPRNDRDWSPEYANLPVIEMEKEIVTIRNFRNFRYSSPTDFEENWETRTYDLAQLEGLDMFFSYWGSPYIAHTVVSWQFENSKPLVISIETRREKGESYSALGGFFRQYELYYVVTDETDVIKLRTDYRKEQVYLYRLRAKPALARRILLDYFRSINGLNSRPEWYNAATENCTTTIRQHVETVAGSRPWTWKILVNGLLPQLAYQRGTINNTQPFEEIQRRSFISQKARALPQNEDYSQGIRRGLPSRPKLAIP